MKIKNEHLQILRDGINKVLEKHPNVIETYENGHFARSGKVKDLQTRFCFDLLKASGLNDFVCKTLYQYMNDTHIKTALKSICPTVERRY
jgi:hypothetical protein